MKRALFVVAILVFVQGYAIAGDVTTFKDGAVEAAASLETPEFSDLVEMSIPAESHIVKATMDIVSVPPDDTVLTSPRNVSLYLDDTLLWRYDGQDYGYFGLQDRFTNDTPVLSDQYGTSGGQTLGKVRLPKRGMDVKSASFDVDCEGQWRGLVQVLNLTGTGNFGSQVAGIGDVNNDSYDDIMVSAFTFNTSKGAAFIFFGGPAMDAIADLTLDGVNQFDYFGYSVAGGADINGDGIDDVVVGAPYAMNGNGDFSGQAYVFFGGNNMDATADATLSGEYDGDDFGVSVAIAGDVNKDGLADLIVGADGNDNVDYEAGAAYIFFGNNTLNKTADVTLLGEYYEDYFGSKVSGAGDVNNDGAQDVLVGALGNDEDFMDGGKVYMFLGGASMNTVPDLTVLGTFDNAQLGTAFSGAGDVNNDGYGDIVIGSEYDQTTGLNAGAAFVYHGGASMDGTADVTMFGTAENDYFGISVSGAGDLNNDGFDDVMVGAFFNDSGGSDAGSVTVFLGGAPMNNVSDIVLTGNFYQNYFGWTLAPTGDLNGDGFTGILVGTGKNNARLYESMFGVKEPQVTFGQTLAWSKPWYFNDSAQAANFADTLNSYISSNYATGVDAFGNTYIDVPVKLSCKSDGKMTVNGLQIKYVCTEPVAEFTDALEAYKAAHKGEKDAGGNITVPFKIASGTAGNVKLANLKISLDEAPRLLSQIPDFKMNEDSVMSDQINLREYFADDYDSIDNIQFALVSYTNNTSVAVELLPNGFLTIDASSGLANDNWTGVVEIRVNASDRWGSTTSANPFKVVVEDVPDAPVITSQPGLDATPGHEYIYNVTAVDGDGDMLTFDLAQKPAGMTMDPLLGNITWMPTTAGKYDISIMVSDGNLTAYQNFTIIIPNRIPVITNFTVPEALVGVAWEYAIQVQDPDGNPLNFSFITPVSGMNLDPKTGILTWTPAGTGTFPVSVAISDGKDTMHYDFNVTVRQPNRNPKFTSTAVLSGVEGLPYAYTATATDDDGNPLAFSLISGPAGMTINATSGLIAWTPADDGDFAVSISVADGLGGEAKQEFTIKVAETAKPKVTVQDPDPLSAVAWKGKVTISGIVRKGTYDVSYIEVKIDSGSWKRASGNSTWSFDLDTTKLKNGPHTYGVRVFDSKNNSDEMPGVFIVNNVAAKGTDYTLWIIIAVVVLVVAALAGAGLAMARKKPPAAQDAGEQEPAAGEGESEGEAAEEEGNAQEEEEKEEKEEEEKEEKEEEEKEEKEEEEEGEEEEEKKP